MRYRFRARGCRERTSSWWSPGAATAPSTARVCASPAPAFRSRSFPADRATAWRAIWLIPFNPTARCRSLRLAATRAIDAGDLHGSLFFNVAGIGFDARIAGRLASRARAADCVGYVIATVSELRALSSQARYSIHNAFDVDGNAHMADIIDQPALFIALANSRQYGSGAQIAPSALLDDGMIEIVVVEPQSALQHHAAGAGVFPRHAAGRPGPADAIARRRWRSRASIRFVSTSTANRGKGRIRIALQTRRGVLLVKVSH